MKEKMYVVDYCVLSANYGPSEKICDYYNYSSANLQKKAKYKWSGVANIYSRYKALGSTINNNSYSLHGINAYNFCNYAYLLNDGAVVYFGGLWEGPWIVVDVNNYTKGPNEIGRDVFIIKVYSNTKTNQHWIKPAGAKDTPDYNTASSGSSGCSKDIGAKSTNCVYKAAGAGCSAYYLYTK